jgi:hypothetical protein
MADKKPEEDIHTYDDSPANRILLFGMTPLRRWEK